MGGTRGVPGKPWLYAEELLQSVWGKSCCLILHNIVHGGCHTKLAAYLYQAYVVPRTFSPLVALTT